LIFAFRVARLVVRAVAAITLVWPCVASSQAPAAVPPAAAASDPAVWPSLRLEPLQDTDVVDQPHGCHGVLRAESGERLGVSEGKTLKVRLNLPLWSDSAQKEASPMVAFWMYDQTGTFGRYRSRAWTGAGLQRRGRDYTLVASLQLSGRTACPAEANRSCVTHTGTLDFGYLLPSDETDEDDDFHVAHKAPPQKIVLKEECPGANARAYFGLALNRRVLDTAAGYLFFWMGGTR